MMDNVDPAIQPQLCRTPTTVPAMRMQPRDGALLQFIYAADGVVAKRHLKQEFWAGATTRAMEMRLSRLYRQDYISWPTREEWRAKPVPEPICWLGWKGVLWIAGQRGLNVVEPTKPSEMQLRRLEKSLRSQGVRWVREPHWSQLEHDLAIIDVKCAVQRAVHRNEFLQLERWVPESDFLIRLDVVACQETDTRGGTRLVTRGVRPDGYFAVVDSTRMSNHEPCRARFLLEVDMATVDIGSFAETKVVPGLRYLQSLVYQARFGDNSGRWLVVTTSASRLKHLMAETTRTAGIGASSFLFSTLDEVVKNDILTSPIWQQSGQPVPVSLV